MAESISRPPICERRHNRHVNQSPMAILEALPALVVLERIPVPVLAVAHDNCALFTNEAFADMLGRTRDAVLALTFPQIFHILPADESAITVMRAHASRIVELLHRDGSIVRATMSKSALLRGDDPIALAMFQDLTEQLWDTGSRWPRRARCGADG